jgi:hypothetical protein
MQIVIVYSILVAAEDKPGRNFANKCVALFYIFPAAKIE